MKDEITLSEFHRLYTLLLLLIAASMTAQLDSIHSLVKKEKDPIKKITLLLESSHKYNGKPIATVLAREAYGIALNTKNDTLCGQTAAQIGLAGYNSGECDSLIFYQDIALKFFEAKKFDDGIFNLLSIRSRYLLRKNKHKEVLELNKQLIDLAEKLNDPEKLGKANARMAALFMELNNNTKAISYYNKSIEQYIKCKDSIGLENSYLYLGNCLFSNKEYEKALNSYNLGLKINAKTNNPLNKSIYLLGFGNIYYEKNDLENALSYYKQALTAKESIERDINIVLNIGTVYMEMKKYEEAKEYLLEAYKVFEAKNERENIAITSFNLAQLYDHLGEYKLAMSYITTYISINDSINLAQNAKAFSEIEAKYQNEKKEEQNVLLKERIKNKSLQMYFALGGIFLLICLAFLIFRGLKQNQKANRSLAEKNKIIEEKSNIVEEQNKNITDSIKYAQRIQHAILPPVSLVQKYLPNSFILYKPKDIVAGDFYWIHGIQNTKGEVTQIIIAAADCTGHGVPGAMVSVVCSNALNRTVNEFFIYEPGKILDKTRELVLATFAQSESDVKDGMDISLCRIDLETNKVSWSGANNPLWYFKDNELKEIHGHKQSIGKTENPSPFPTHILDLNQGDKLYLITDGYADQFGGIKGKKFKYKQLEEILIANNHLELQQQSKILNKTFENWKGDLEQVDDVTIIGIRL